MNSLKQAVIEQLGYTVDDLEHRNEDLISELSDIANYGIDGGFGGFVYYHDTIEFFNKNKINILELAKNLAEEFGVGVYKMIAGFNCINDLSEQEVVDAIYTEEHEFEAQVKNALSWFAAEEIARIYQD